MGGAENMANLLFYTKESVGYVHLTSIKIDGKYQYRCLSSKNAQLVVKKLVRHFKLFAYNFSHRKYPKIIFSPYMRGGGICYPSNWIIKLSNNPSLAVVVHEVGHLKVRKHTKKLLKLIGKMLNYCAKNNYWGMC